MANLYKPEQLGITPPAEGFQTGGWYQGRQFWGGTLSDPGVIHPASVQQGAGQAVSPEVRAQSASAQGVSTPQFEGFLQGQQRQAQQIAPVAQAAPQAPQGITTPQPGVSQPSGQATGLMGALGATPSINLPEIYKGLYAQSAIPERESRLRDLETKYLAQKGKISDNPFLSASMVDQRLQRLQRKYEEETVPLRNEIATAKADIETQLNLQTKQFDINSTQARNALSYFNTLLDMGALDNASGETIASITRSTGIPSEMIMSAVGNRKKADTQMITSTAENGEVFAVVVNSDTGEIVNKQSLGIIGNVQGGGAQEMSETEQLRIIQDDLRSQIQGGITLQDAFRIAVGYLDPEQIYILYNTHSPYGAAKETFEQALSGQFENLPQ